MDFLTYLTTSSPQFGAPGWLFFIGQILLVGAGAYLYFVHTERNMARGTFMRQLATALMVLGGVGVVLGILRLLNVPVMNQHLWFYIQFVIELLVAGYVFYYMRSVLPGLEKAAANRRPTTARSSARAISDVQTSPPTPRPVATTSRRDARRDRKRRKG